MGDVYQNIDFERMLSDLGQALERNKAGAPDTQPTAYPKPVEPGGVPTARFPDAQPGMSPMAQQMPPMTVQGAPPPPAAYSPQDMQTLAELNAATPGAMQFGAGVAPHPAHAPPPAIAAQLAGVAAKPTAASAPPTQYPQLAQPALPDDPNAAGGLAAYAAMR